MVVHLRILSIICCIFLFLFILTNRFNINNTQKYWMIFSKTNAGRTQQNWDFFIWHPFVKPHLIDFPVLYSHRYTLIEVAFLFLAKSGEILNGTHGIAVNIIFATMNKLINDAMEDEQWIWSLFGRRSSLLTETTSQSSG